MLNLPKGVWRWVETNLKDIGRLATAAEKAVEELRLIRKTLEEGWDKS